MNARASTWAGTTLRRILVNAGLSSPRRRRPPKHRVRRQRMPREGMLIQMDGSYHRWLGDDGPQFTILFAVDDATGCVLKVYPRVCGGTGPSDPPPDAPQGLSPRVRGNHLPAMSKRGLIRSIPRVRGNRDAVQHARHSGGLSPRVRGNLVRDVLHRDLARSIPACAGEPFLDWPCSW